MNRIILVLVILFPVLLLSYTIPVNNAIEAGLNLTSQSNSGISLTYSIDEFLLEDVNVNGDTLQKIMVKKCFLPGQAGAPDIPSISTYIALPQGATVSANIISYKTVSYNNIDLAPAFNIPYETDDSLTYFFDTSIYQNNDYYPNNFWLLGANDLVRGVDCCAFAIIPFRYNPITDELILYYDIQIVIDFIGGNGHFGEDRLRSRWWEPINQSFFINNESLPEIDFDNVLNQRPGEFEYIIIIPQNGAFLPAAQILSDFRNRQGIRTGIFQIGQDITSNTASAIKNFISDAYENWETTPEACLLLGDYGTTSHTITSKEYSYPVSPNSTHTYKSDNYFADMNDNGLPDITLGRISEQSLDDINEIVAKIVDYEENPATDSDFYNNPILSCGWQTSRWFTLCTEIVNGFMTDHLNKNPVREYDIYQGTPGEIWSSNSDTYQVIDYFGPNGLDYLLVDSPGQLGDPQSYTWTSNASRINQSLNNSGGFLLLFRDHGQPLGWSYPSYTVSDISGLNNPNLPFIFSLCCNTGKFENDNNCLTDEFLCNPTGAIGLIAASDISYSFVTDVFTWGIWDYLWSDFMPDYGSASLNNLLPSHANCYGKYFLQYNYWDIDTNINSRMYNIYHHFGDVFTSIFSEVPQTITMSHPQYINPETNEITVTTEPGVFLALSVNGEIIETEMTNGTNTVLNIDQQEMGTIIDIVATKRNHIRYSSEIEVRGSFIYGVIELPDILDNSNISVKLMRGTSSIVAETTTNYNGMYTFYNIDSGTYFLDVSILDPAKAHYPYISDSFYHNEDDQYDIQPTITLTPINIGMILVSQNPEVPSFRDLEETILFINNYICSDYYSGEDINVYLTTGLYETPNYMMYYILNPIDSEKVTVSMNGISNVEFRPVHYQGNNVDDPLSFILQNVNLEINNITFTQYSTAIELSVSFNSSLAITGCSFEENGLYWNESIMQYQSFSSGSAFKFENHSGDLGEFQLKIENCNFVNNSVSIGYNQSANINSIPIDEGLGGVICIDLRQSEYDNMEININNNSFTNNSANYGGVIFINDVENVTITNNEFSYNGFVIIDENEPTHYAKKGAVLTIIDSDILIEGNTFYENDNISSNGLIYGQYVNWLFENNEIYSVNNSYISNDDLSCLYIESANSSKIINDIYCEYSDDPDFAVNIDDSPYEISYCLTYGDFDQSYVVDGSCSISDCLECDPQLDINCIPQWDTASISPCVDAGNPDTDGDGLMWYEDDHDRDSDGTRKDIGAVPPIEHNMYQTTLPQNGEFNIKWMCFPAVNNLTNNMDQYINVVPDLLVPNQTNSPLNLIQWKPVEEDNYPIVFVQWTGTGWSNENYLIDPAQGFVFTMDGAEPTYIEVSGFNEDINREITLYAGQENWVGYFLEEKQSYLDAIQDFKADLWMVKGQYQSITKIDGTWQGNVLEPLEYGDMVKIFTTTDIDFQWHNPSGGGGTTKETKLATNYLWEEEEDYIPVIVTLGDSTLPLEIGVYSENECKGAAVVEDSTSIICTYISDDPGAELSLDLYYGREEVSRRIKPKLVIYDEEDRFIRISLTGEYDNVPLPVELSLTNYPNPFNPSTTIEYSVKEVCHVELNVYNIKGQLIKHLVNEQKEPGQYQIIWDGKDSKGLICSSGIYFCQMRAGKEVIHDRMMLIK